MQSREWIRKDLFFSEETLEKLEKEADAKGINVEKHIRVNKIGNPEGVN